MEQTEKNSKHIKKSKEYHRFKNRLFFIQLIINFVLLIAFMLSGFSLALKNFSFQYSENFLIGNGIYIMAVAVIMYILHFPLNFVEGFTWEHRFNLSNQKFIHWLRDDVKKASLGLVVTVLMVEVIYVLLRRFPDSWWMGATFFWLLLNLVLARLMPNALIPLFYKYSDIENEQLKVRILELFKKCKVKIKNAYAINFSSKTNKANAFVCGLGNNRRVVLSDNLLHKFTDEEIETVVAHELGHYKNHDIIKITLVASYVTFLSFYMIDVFLKKALVWFQLERIDDIAFFPMLAAAFLVLNLFVMPALNAFSRRLEREADIFSMKTTGKPKSLASAFRKLGDVNLAEFEPNKFIEIFLYDHPPLAQRIKFVENFPLT